MSRLLPFLFSFADAPRPETQILTSYIDISLPRSLRQQDLLKRYFFICSCVLCERPAREPGWTDPREAFLPSIEREGIEDWVKEGMKVLQLVDAGSLNSKSSLMKPLMNSRADAFYPLALEQFLALPASQPILTHLSNYLPPTAYPLLPLLRHLSTLLVEALGSQSTQDRTLLEDAMSYSRLVSIALGTSEVYPSGHPARAMALAEFGKLLLLPVPSQDGGSSASKRISIVPPRLRFNIPEEDGQRLRLAREVLLQALWELRIGFGSKGGLVGRDVEGLLEGSEREIGFQMQQQSAAERR